MNLDDLERFEAIDRQDMAAQIADLPQQLARAWQMGESMPLPETEGLSQIVIAGLGGSAIGADLLAAYTAPTRAVPLVVWRNYEVPGFVRDAATLVIACSHSGNTEETLSAFESALERGARLLAITTGGELAERAEEVGAPLWQFDHEGQPRAAVGYAFGLSLSALSRMRLVPDPSAALEEAVAAMEHQQKTIEPPVEVADNPAKRMAGQMVERWPTIIGADHLTPVARRWRTQIAELTKAVAQFEVLPEADHNMVAGVEAPERLFGQTMVVLLDGSGLHPRNRARTQITRELLMLQGFNTDIIEAKGESRLAQQWSSLHFGDYVAYYLAMAYGIDPTPVDVIEELKARMESA